MGYDAPELDLIGDITDVTLADGSPLDDGDDG